MNAKGLQIEPRTNATIGTKDHRTMHLSFGPLHASERPELAVTFKSKSWGTKIWDGYRQTTLESEVGTRWNVEIVGGLEPACMGKEGKENNANVYMIACNIVFGNVCARDVR